MTKKWMLNMTLVKGHHDETRRTVRKFCFFTRQQYAHNYTILFVGLGKAYIARIDFWQYTIAFYIILYPALYSFLYPFVMYSISPFITPYVPLYPNPLLSFPAPFF
jgi:hypothetical protein